VSSVYDIVLSVPPNRDSFITDFVSGLNLISVIGLVYLAIYRLGYFHFWSEVRNVERQTVEIKIVDRYVDVDITIPKPKLGLVRL
jgi:hypothetical protein